MLKMKSLNGFLKFRQKEIDLLQDENRSQQKDIDSLLKENKLLLDAVYPLISLGIPLEKLADVLKQIDLLQNENKSKQLEIDLLRKEKKLLLDAVYPLTSSGISLENLADVLKQFAKSIPKTEIEINRHDASYHDSEIKLASNESLTKFFSKKSPYVDKPLGSDKTIDDLIKDLLDSRKNIRFPPISEESNPELSKGSKLIQEMEIKRLDASFHDSGGKLSSNQNIASDKTFKWKPESGE
jgi:hypothetical protein